MLERKLNDAAWVDASALMRRRAVKDDDEIDDSRQAAAVADAALKRLLGCLGDRATSAELAAEARPGCQRLGARDAVLPVNSDLHQG